MQHIAKIAHTKRGHEPSTLAHFVGGPTGKTRHVSLKIMY